MLSYQKKTKNGFNDGGILHYILQGDLFILIFFLISYQYNKK